MKIIRFTRRQPPYNAGEIAGFADAVADEHVRRGNAVEYKPEDSETKAESAERPRRKPDAKSE